MPDETVFKLKLGSADLVDDVPSPSLASPALHLARFPLRAPSFSASGGKGQWRLVERNDANGDGSPVLNLTHDALKAEDYTGREAGNQAKYYFFVKRGDDFFAVPCEGWYNFKPTVKAASDDAAAGEDGAGFRMSKFSIEERIKSRLNKGSRLASGLLAQSRSDAPARGSGGLEDVDEVIKTETDSFLKRKLAMAQRRKQAEAEEAGGAPLPGDGGDREVGEDWEHEQSFDDDDEAVEVDMTNVDDQTKHDAQHNLESLKKHVRDELTRKGKQEEGEEEDDFDLNDFEGGRGMGMGGEEGGPSRGDGVGSRAPGGIAPDSETALEEISRKKKEMAKALSKIGLGEDAHDLGKGEGGLGGGAGGEDDVDYENVAEEELKDERAAQDMPVGPSGASKAPATQPSGTPAGALQPKTEASKGDEAKGKRRRDADGAAATQKRIRIAPMGPPTNAEIVSYLTENGKMLSSELISHFKKRLKNKEQQAAFLKAVKAVAKLESEAGKKFVVLKE